MRSKEAKKAYDRAYYLANREKLLARSMAHHKKHQTRTNERQKEYFHRKSKWNRVPGWTKESYLLALTLQKGLCAICQDNMLNPVRDHNHITGLARRLLCHQCNLLLGNAKDNMKILEAAIKYLNQTNGAE